MAKKKREISGICVECWGLGHVAGPKGTRVKCEGCDGKGERTIVFIEETNDD